MLAGRSTPRRQTICAPQGIHDASKMKYFFKLVTGARIYLLCATSSVEMKEWIGDLCKELFPAPSAVAAPAAVPAVAPSNPPHQPAAARVPQRQPSQVGLCVLGRVCVSVRVFSSRACVGERLWT